MRIKDWLQSRRFLKPFRLLAQADLLIYQYPPVFRELLLQALKFIVDRIGNRCMRRAVRKDTL